MSPIEKRDPWLPLTRHTAARIALGRAGGSVRTETLLDFRLAHARAKDAVELPFDDAALTHDLAGLGLEAFGVCTQASDRRSYLLRPDLGRQLESASREALSSQGKDWGARDVCVIVSDGLSALAASRQVTPLLAALLPLLSESGVSLYPVLVAPFARVKLGDEVGEILGARHTLVLIGERPGLSSPDSLGAYLTFRPRAACTDADRNCVSNIRPEGLSQADAARTLAELLLESSRLGLSGVSLRLPA